MPTTNPRGLPLYSDSEAMPDWNIAYNAQSNALSTALDDSEQASKDDDSVEFIGDLPVVDNWLGRLIYVEEDDNVRVWDGAGWDLLDADVRQQVDTTDTFVPRPRTQYGFGRITGDNTFEISKTVTFPQPYSDVPSVTASYMGYKSTGGGFDRTGLFPGSAQRVAAVSVTTTGFTLTLIDTSVYSSGADFYFTWHAIGEA